MAEKQVEKTEEPKLESKLPEIKKVEIPKGDILSAFGGMSQSNTTISKVRERAEKAFEKLDKETAKKEENKSKATILIKDTQEVVEAVKEIPANEKTEKLRTYAVRANESAKKTYELIEQGATDEKIQEQNNITGKNISKARDEAINLRKQGDLSVKEMKALDKIIDKLDNALVSLTKMGLDYRDTLRERQNDEIFERTLERYITQKSEIEKKSLEDIYIGLSKYYLAINDMKKEIEKINGENLNDKEKEKKIKETYDKYYDELKIGNTKHDETLNSFLIYNMTLEFGSKDMKEKIADQIFVEDENGKKTTLSNRSKKEVIELYNSCVSSPGFGWNEKEGCHKINQ